MPATTVIYTLDYPGHSPAASLALLATRGIAVLVDIRRDATRVDWAPVNQNRLRAACLEQGLTYHWAGRHLGDPALMHLDAAGNAAVPQPIARLLHLAAQAPTAIGYDGVSQGALAAWLSSVLGRCRVVVHAIRDATLDHSC